MSINIYKDQMQKARLFGASVLYSRQPIPREDVPSGWYCYDLCGTAEDPERAYRLVDQAEKNHSGSVLSRLSLKNGRSQSRLVKGMFELTCVSVSLKKFCMDENIRCPEIPIRHMLRPASPDEAGFFYAQTPEKDEEMGAVGHVRIDFGHGGKEGFYHTWWPRGPQELNTQEFQDELGRVVNDLRKSVLKDLSSMRRYCCDSGGAIGDSTYCQNYGFTLETDRYTYRLRCNPIESDYQAYLSCFDKQAQRQEYGLTESGLQKLQDTADPSFPHSYDWYVMEDCSTAYAKFTDGLSLDEAIQRYSVCESDDKRLGVTKDDVAAVDLVIRHDGREWVSEDWTKSESFAQDPVVAGAVTRMRQLLEEQTPDQGMTMGGNVLMLEVVQAPVSRDMLQQWVEDRHGVLMDVRHDDIELRLYNEAIFPEISVLFMGETSKYLDAVEICGMYDIRTREFRFVSDQLAAIVDGIPEVERWTVPDESEDIYAEICRYAKEAVEQRGYKFEDSSSAIYAGLRQTVQSGLSDMIDYAAVLSARGERDAVLDTRDLALEMLHFWRDPVYDTYEKGYDRLEQQYTEKLDQAVQRASNSNQAPAFDEQKAANILGCLATHAEEVTQNNDSFSVWECCRLAKRLQKEFPQQAGIFQGDFKVDESERFSEFGSKDREQLQEGWLLGKPVLVFSHPVPEEQVPEGWHSYHLAGRNLYRADKLLKAMPESGYVGTVLSPYSFIRASYQSRQIQNRFGCCGGYVSMAEFCERNHLPQPVQVQIQKMEIGGMSL